MRQKAAIYLSILVAFVPCLGLVFGDTTITVDPNGFADYTTIQAAVDAVPSSNSIPIEIHIAPGIYHEHVHLTSGQKYVSLIGSDPSTTLITYDTPMDEEGFTVWTSATVYIEASYFSVEGVSIENSYGTGVQTLAFSTYAHYGQFKNVWFLSNQDTLLLYNGPFYLINCRVEGTTDFIYGNATSWFENCEIYSRAGNYITASNCDSSVDYGFVFNNCQLTRAETLGDETVYLGRTWITHSTASPSVAYLNCWMDGHIKAEGWNDWGDSTNRETCRYSEYNSFGPGGDMTNRADWTGVSILTDEEALVFSMTNVLGSWSPSYADTSSDVTPPTPDPITWSEEPHVSAAKTVSMTTSLAQDINGVEYYFSNVTDPSHDSGWQSSNEYVDTDLNIGQTYTYKARARDLSENNNETGWTDDSSVTMPDNPMELEEVYLLPDDDSRLYVLGGTNTYGSYDSLWARDLGNTSLMNTGVLQFTLPSDGRIFVKAKLELVNKRDNAGNALRVFALQDGVSGEDIDESTITYSTASGIDTTAATLNSDTVELYSVDSGLAGELMTTPDSAQETMNDFISDDTNGIVTFYAASNTGAIQIGTKEADAAYKPYLHLWYLNNGCDMVYLGDINADCKVDIIDFSIFSAQWLGAPQSPPADIMPMGATDGSVDMTDLVRFLEDWLGGIQ